MKYNNKQLETMSLGDIQSIFYDLTDAQASTFLRVKLPVISSQNSRLDDALRMYYEPNGTVSNYTT